jgi:hypothetical protein
MEPKCMEPLTALGFGDGLPDHDDEFELCPKGERCECVGYLTVLRQIGKRGVRCE